VAKTKSRQKFVQSLCFGQGAAIWRSPKQVSISPISPIYHEAVETLADWIGPGWDNNKKTGFFPLRDLILKQIETWRQYDWQLDENRISKTRIARRNSKNIISTFDNFNANFSDSEQTDALVWLGHSIAGFLHPGLPRNGSNEEYAENVKRGLKTFRSNFVSSLENSVRFGPLEYETLPKQLPHRQIAMAILLCDLISSRRLNINDSGIERSLRTSRWDGNQPRISKNVPWHAIGLFVTADSNASDADIEIANLQHRVKSAIKSVSSIHLRPMT